MDKINVLQILAGSNEYNGVSDFLVSYYHFMDRNKVRFDFLFCKGNSLEKRKNEPVFSDSSFFPLGLKTTGRLKDSLNLIRKVKDVVREGKYDIVHINTGSIYLTVCCIIAAARAKVPHIVSHSHNSDAQDIRRYSRIKKIYRTTLNAFGRCFIRHRCSLLFACSDKAGIYLFGQKGVSGGKYHKINNAIRPELFLYDPQKRNTIRSENGIGEATTVLGCVGRLSAQKNHGFLLDVFAEYQKLNPDSVLWLIGEGDNRSFIEEKIRALGLEASVRLLGYKKNVNDYLQAMDVFILTSFFEGLSISAVEAQASGLRLFIPDELSHETDITGLVHFIPISDTAGSWAKKIHSETSEKYERKNMYKAVLDAGYDIQQAAKGLEKIYSDLKQS